MKEINIKYIEENYLEFEEVLKLTNFSPDKLNQLIADKIIPGPSYVIDSEVRISSSLNDSHKIISSKKYFAKNILELIKDSSEKSYENLKEDFKQNLLSILKKHNHRKFAYGNVFDENDEINLEKTNELLEEEWEYFCKGVYGICTLRNNENAIIEKEIIIKRILDFIANKDLLAITEHENYLKELNVELNKSTSLFAPYQRETSSRGKYLDKLLEEYTLTDLIKRYD
nr:DUF6058 family natural product biosynthesis protein [uncultured Flavobacterium sp.]